MKERSLLVIIAVDYDSSVKKGVEKLLTQYDEDAFFSKVNLLCPYIRKDRNLKLSSRVTYHELGWRINVPFLKRLISPLHLIRLIFLGCNIVKKGNVQIIRATEPGLCGALAWFIAHLTGVPYCISLHADYDLLNRLNMPIGGKNNLGLERLKKELESWILKRAKRVFLIRQSLFRYATNRCVRSENIRIIPHGINLNLFKNPSNINIRTYFKLLQDIKIISFAGRLSKENYIDDLIAAIKRVALIRDDFCLLIAGGGPLENEIIEKVKNDLVLSPVVRILGFINQELVYALRQQCDLSICLMGGFSLIEACAAGRPVISYDIEWHNELVIDDFTGALIPEHDINNLEKKILCMLDSPKDCDRMGDNARALAFLKHDISKTTLIKQQYYLEMLESK